MRQKKVYNESTVERPQTGHRFYKQALEVIWLAIIFLVPLFFNPLSHNIFHLGKTLLLEFLVMSMLAFWIADWIFSRASHNGLKWRGLLNSPLHISILFFGLIVALSTVASITPAISFWGSYDRQAGLLKLICWILFFLILAHQLRSRAQLLRAVYTLLLSSGIVSLLGILQHFFPDVMSSVLKNPYTFGGRVYSTIGNPLFLSSFLAIITPFTLALIVYSWNKRKEHNNTRILIGLVILLALQLWCLWLAQYSITILLYIIAPIIFIILLGIVKRKRLIISLGFVFLLALGIIATVLIGPLLLSSTAVDTPEPEDLEPVPIAEDVGLRTLDIRMQFWQSTIDMFLESPEVPFSNDRLSFLRKAIGYGPETFTITFQLFFPDELRSEHVYRSMFVDRPHNDFLYLATTIGLLGLIGFLSILAVFFYLCVRYLRQATADIDKLLLIAMAAGMVQYTADIFFNLSTISPELVFWLMLAMTCIIGRFIQNREPVIAKPEEAKQPESEPAPHITRARLIISICCAVALLIVGTFITIRPLLADMYLQKGIKLQDPLQDTQSESPMRAFAAAPEMYPRESTYWNFLGRYSYEVALHVEDEALQDEALSLAMIACSKAAGLRHYFAYDYYVLADICVYWAETRAADKWPLVLSLYDKASQLFPRNAVILNRWALALIVKGDLDEARAKLDYSASIDPSWTETSFLHGLLLAKESKNDEAVSKLVAPIQDNPANLYYFSEVCRRLAMYDMISPVSSSLESYNQELPDNWITHALLGITSLFDNDLDKSLDELNTAMFLVPDDDAGDLFRAILNLTSRSSKFKAALPGVAAEWRDKLAQSPERDTLLPALDQLVGTAQ